VNNPQATLGQEETFSLEDFSLKKIKKRAIREAERQAILNALNHTRWNRRKAAVLLEISYKALLNKIKEYGLEKI